MRGFCEGFLGDNFKQILVGIVSLVVVHVGGAGVAQEVAASRFLDARLFHGAFDPVAQVGGGQAGAVAADEQGALAERHGAAFAAFALAHGEDAAGEVEVFEVEFGHLAAAQAAGVEHFEDAAVAQAEGVGGVVFNLCLPFFA